MDDRKLQVMLTTLRTGSFGKAALELDCSQPAVTQQINSMENELGCKLFTRSHNGVQLTPAGEALLPLIVEADACYSRLMDQAKVISQGGLIPIRIAVFASIATTWLPKVIKDYEKINPGVTFEIRVGTNIIYDWFRLGEIDIALADKNRCDGQRWYPLMDDPYLAVLQEGMVDEGIEEIHMDELKKYPFIRAPLNALITPFDSKGDRSLTISSDDNNALLSMVAMGMGVSILPKLSLNHLPQGIRILELTPPMKRVLGIGISSSASRAAKDFVSFIRKQMPYSV